MIALNRAQDGCCGVVLADGVGSWDRSAEASRAAANAAARTLRAGGAAATGRAARAAGDAVLPVAPGEAGTTLVVATVDAAGRVWCAYVGNGALIEIAVVEGRDEPLWVNHLMPHTGYENGVEVLTRSIVSGQTRSPVPSLLMIGTARQRSAFLVVSDGILSREQQPLARTPDGRSWDSIPEALSATLQFAGALLVDAAERSGALEVDLAAQLEGHMKQLSADRLIDDDASVGLIILGDATPCP